MGQNFEIHRKIHIYFKLISPFFFKQCYFTCKQHKQFTRVPRRDAECALSSLTIEI